MLVQEKIYAKGMTRTEYERKRNVRRKANSIPRKCIVCGSMYKAFHKKTITCGMSCGIYLTGIVGREQTKKEIEITQAKRALHFRTGPFVTNCRSKYWSLKSPEGIIYKFVNLALFVREHETLFSRIDLEKKETRYSCLVSHQLARLRPDRSYSINSWKGWMWSYAKAEE